MQRLLPILLLLCLACGRLAAQSATEAALLGQLRTHPSDTGRVRLLNALCYELHDSAPTRALTYGEQGVALARSLRDQSGLLQGLLNLGSCYANLADGPHALQLQQEALHLARRLNSADGIVRSYAGMGGVYHERNDTAAALVNYRRALERVYQPGVRVRTQLMLFGNLGNLYFYLGRRQEALVFTRRALQLARRTGDRAGESLYLADLGSFYLQMDQLETAEGLLRQAVTLVEPLNTPRFEAGHLELLATALLIKGEIEEAEELTRRALALSRRIQYRERVLDAYSLMAEINASQRNFEQAYVWQNRFRDLNDSLNSRSRVQTLTALQTRYETAEKESQIRQLTERSVVSQQRNRALWGAIAALLLGLSGMGLLYGKLRRSRAALATNHRILEEATQELRQLAASKDRLYAIVAHDLRGPVTSFAGVTELIDFYLKQGDEKGLRRLPNLVRQSAHQLNHLLDNLLNWAVNQTGELAFRPERLSAIELLVQALELYANTAEAKQITLQLEAPPELAVWADAHMTQTVLRNLVGNALKFTPSGGTICLRAKALPGSGVQLSVADSGTGMAASQVAAVLTDTGPSRPLKREPGSGTGLGLLLCRAFMHRQGGSLDIKSAPGQGTTVSVTLPAARGRSGSELLVL
ncbi:tetratricopeptide repeat-containing sensor histidine kinase [Hymenobacter sp. HSC-4F20]|uniref:sensor histidine kinase n=1 Tax=Hymenobacter sp. HSC-4F20 TaxID=2864135 RepID=UPI001C731ACA|nr:ATP-binding protein [Hymenobacter sp. HSC-4F20]MBX0292772.1 tetratricopeptide repeat-containing sensor histidine kinase [Hymenobacter sp. HSC-4F20]